MKSLCIIDEYGNKFWRNEKDELHREDGPAIEIFNGTKEWYINGQLHREDGPAIKYRYGGKEWYINGKRHREDGPAIEWNGGEKHYFINDIEYTKKEYYRRIKLKAFW